MTTASTSETTEDTTSASQDTGRRTCYYRSPAHRNTWQPRLDLEELEIGQELQAVVVQELLDAKTGPKLFVDVGVGRYRPQYAHTAGLPNAQRRDWQIVTAMLRVPDRKESVARKRAARLRKKACFPVYVSRIRPENAALEVMLQRHQALETAEASAARQPVQVGQVVTGRVTDVRNYGVLVDIGAKRRHGLLHIQTVADLLGCYIDQASGLSTKAGLRRGTRVQLQVAAVAPNGDIALEFTKEAQEAAAVERKEQEKEKKQPTTAAAGTTASNSSTSDSSVVATVSTTGLSKEEEEAWAAFAANPTATQSSQQEDDYDDEDEEDDDDYDEDREIEDALGLGSY